MSEGNHIKYTYDGGEKQAVWRELMNGMRLNVTVPISEINSAWQQMIIVIVIVSAVLIVVSIILTMRFTGHITKPLRELTDACEEVDNGNYDVILKYNKNNEVGLLSRTLDRLIAHLKIYISDLNSLAHTDALTAVSNKGTYDVTLHDMQQRILDPNDSPEFAIAIFDCDDLKLINDRYGHDKGDRYLKNTSAIICHVFSNSQVYRIGGDEFAVILEGEDYKNLASLKALFEQSCLDTCVDKNAWWDQVMT